jgi:hypothetical protein
LIVLRLWRILKLVLSLEIGKEELEETGKLSSKGELVDHKAEKKVQEDKRESTRSLQTERETSEEENGFKEEDWKSEIRRLRKRVRELEDRRGQ